ncbi:hypothetical protein M422DRAFT_783224 [Sphaerobolus stellatus SS14]|uniref:MFS transporter n=1 Tax=Sphaerobolus stellatus (strain SS14) TaxID=990650 RepID=A0A0C9V6X6_SPHS4|nr:hypothetical protein M422DRAFT_783224 [Sphaerobolus stellatus SS14]
MKLYWSLLFLMCFLGLINAYPLALPQMAEFVAEQPLGTVLGSPAPLLTTMSTGLGGLLPQLSIHASRRDLAASIATTMLGGGLALYFT